MHADVGVDVAICIAETWHSRSEHRWREGDDGGAIVYGIKLLTLANQGGYVNSDQT